MNIIEKTLGVKEGQRFTFELATELYPTEEYTYENGYITYLSLWNGKKCGIQGATLIKILSNPEKVTIIHEKKKLPKFVFDWLEHWEDEINNDSDREIEGVHVDCNGVHIKVNNVRKDYYMYCSIATPLLKDVFTDGNITLGMFRDTYECE